MSCRTIEVAGPGLARVLFGWDGPMWRYRNPWGPWTQGEPPPAGATCRDDAEFRAHAERDYR